MFFIRLLFDCILQSLFSSMMNFQVVDIVNHQVLIGKIIVIFGESANMCPLWIRNSGEFSFFIYTMVGIVLIDQNVVKHTMKCLELRKHMFCPPVWFIEPLFRNVDGNINGSHIACYGIFEVLLDDVMASHLEFSHFESDAPCFVHQYLRFNIYHAYQSWIYYHTGLFLSYRLWIWMWPT